MSIYKQVGLILPALFWNLVDADDFDLILDIMEIIEFYASSSYTLEKAQIVATNAVNTVQKLDRRFPLDNSASINLKIPTMHMVLEYLIHDVPLFGHRTSECLAEEHKHQFVSYILDDFKTFCAYTAKNRWMLANFCFFLLPAAKIYFR
jgi:hypothetical protein